MVFDITKYLVVSSKFLKNNVCSPSNRKEEPYSIHDRYDEVSHQKMDGLSVAYSCLWSIYLEAEILLQTSLQTTVASCSMGKE